MARNNNRNGFNIFLAAVIGAFFGALAALLINEDTREKLIEKSKDLKDKAEDKLELAEERVEKAKKKTRSKIAKKMKETGEKIES